MSTSPSSIPTSAKSSRCPRIFRKWTLKIFVRDRAPVNDLPALVPDRADLAGGQRGERGGGRQDGGAAPVLLGQPQEIGREGAQAGQQRLDERVLIAGAKQQAGGSFPPDGGGALRAGRGRAERPRPVRRIHRRRLRQREQPAQGRVLRPGQRLRVLRAGQVGAGGRADQQ